ncbi:MAG: hypothetical protein COA79_15820 [Planctomycetota bacterium]|nr:MAG: hypothetical protein COA79_15820 [Planctomycetota bacterium]
MDRIIFGNKEQPPFYRNEITSYDHFYVIFVSSGELFYESPPLKEKVIRKGQLIILRHGQMFNLYTKGKGYKGLFTATTSKDFFYPDKNIPCSIFKTPPILSQLSSNLSEEMQNHNFASKEYLKSIALQILIRCTRIQSSNIKIDFEKGSDLWWSETIKQRLNNSIYTNQSIQEILSELNLSYRQLANIFTKVNNENFKTYFMKQKIQEAQRLMIHTTRSITMIANALHFSSSQHFSTIFKQATGTSPKIYINKL